MTRDQISWAMIFKEFKSKYPNLAKEIVSWRPVGQLAIELLFSDRSSTVYNYLDKTATFVEASEDIEEDDYITVEARWRALFAERMRDIMKANGITLKELSARTGISITSLSYYRQGNKTPNSYNTSLIIKGLGCTASDLLDFE